MKPGLPAKDVEAGWFSYPIDELSEPDPEPVFEAAGRNNLDAPKTGETFFAGGHL
jgi:hypothetical protein